MRLLLAIALASASVHSLGQVVVYGEDFQGSVGSEWSTSSTIVVQASANRIGLGVFDNNSTTLTLSGLTVGQVHTLKFDLYLLNSWDGSQSGNPGPDFFRTRIDGTAVLDATFSVRPEWVQTYSAGTPLGGSQVGGLTDADESGNLDFNFYGSAVYRFGGPNNGAFDFTPTGSTTTIAFDGYNLQGWSDEGWAIDNVQIETVPEPATLLALAGGLAALRWRRQRRQG